MLSFKVVHHNFLVAHLLCIENLNVTVCIVATAVFHMIKPLYLLANVLKHLLPIR
jgi:hypothetical protein